MNAKRKLDDTRQTVKYIGRYLARATIAEYRILKNVDELLKEKNKQSEANYAYYCLHKLRILHSEFSNLFREEKAFVIASIDIKVEADKKKHK